MSHKTPLSDAQIESSYEAAKQQYAALGVDADAAIDAALQLPISLHCWQGDDVGGFETKDEAVEGGGIMATGNFPGKARTADELRQDLKKATDLLPGAHRINLHAFYCETGDEVVDRDQLEPRHFEKWIGWAKDSDIGLDFNPTYFAHPKANDGFTLAHPDKAIRDFWIEHGIVSRRISEAISAALGGEV